MGQSTNAQLCYGIAFDEDTKFPWNAEKFDGEIEQWWRSVLGYKPSFEIFDSDGNWIGGTKPSEKLVEAYFAEMERFDKEHPRLPVTLVSHCSCEYPMYILAVPGTLKTAYRGSPTIVVPGNLWVSRDATDALIAFCNAHGIEVSQPEWYLSSMWC